MLCRLCLIDSIEVLNIFEGDGERLKIAEIIGQHFWFVPTKDDNLTQICCACWSKVDSFHQFYCSIQDAQKNLSQISLFNQNSLLGNTENYVKKENIDNDEWMCDTTVNKYVNVMYDNVLTEDIKIKSEIYDNDESSHEKFEEQDDPIDIDCINGNNDTDSKIRDKACSKNNLITSSENKKKSSDKAKKGPKKRRINNVSDTGEDLSSTHFVENKPKREKNKTFRYLEKYKETDEIIAKFMTLKCEICCEEFTTFAQIQQHFRSKHDKEGYVVCCNRKFYRRVLLLDHINKHLNPESFKCDKCNKSFADSKSLKSHMLMHYSNNSKKFECDICFKKFATNTRLARHKFTHVPPEERRFTCDDCGKPFSTKYFLNIHHRYVHENTYGIMCHICAKLIVGRSMFEKHQLEHAGIVEPGIQCNKCGARLKNKSSLRRHMNLHNESTTYECEICGKISPSKGGLRSHIKYVHELEKTYQCGICDKAFKRASTLKEHMTTHTGEILYTCPYCPQTFSSNSNMRSHRMKKHRKEWEESKKERGLPVNELSLDIGSKDNKNDLKENLVENNLRQLQCK